jgi:hypothetical protein
MVLRPKPRNRRGDFEAQITESELPVLRPNPGNPPPPWFWGSTNKPTIGFEAKPRETVATSFEAKLEKTITAGFEAKPPETIVACFEAKPPETVIAGFEDKPPETVATGFEAKPLETVATGFEAKPVKTVQVVLSSNHSQTVAIDFETQTDEKLSKWFWGQTTHKLSTLVLRLNQETRARCRPHTTPPDLSIARPPSTRPVRQSPVPCTRAPTSGMILVATRHAAPATCTPRDKQTRFSKWNKR